MVIVLLRFTLMLIVRLSVKGKMALDNFILCMPLFGRLIRKIEIGHFIRSFGLLIASGVTVMEALEIAKGTTGNRVVQKAIERIQREVRQGSSITEPLSREELFPPMILQMVSAGEESGSLDVMLKKTADFLDREIDNTVQKLVVRLEPLLTFFLALIVGFIALAIYLPMFDLMGTIAK